MSLLVDTANRKNLHELLLTLNPAAVPLWGKMTPQQMVEHLIENVQYANGTLIPTCRRTAEEAYKAKQVSIYTDVQIPKNLFLGPLPDEYCYADLQTAIKQLMTDLEIFDQYFKTPGTTAIHGGFGPMDYQEWVIWHSKHFTHHFKQFGLLEG
ncbi:hypothetical protein [Mucilaginibacter aquariorum]|uniref:DUF1569 domain-containing protein n=1 Tax=Mucilaginibacter aquariorum TaxID=2967225 RepID=A0ABT1T5X2_9SPHI|nr:hypothetical protein [Mucilaginibacter aquariorum]MCQ6960011.1 hypothetical protein [Mucilaginibacter aquariorum]